MAIASLASVSRVKATRRCKPGILVVDDELLVRRLLKLVLEQQGFTVWLAGNGHEGLRLFQQHQSDVALVLLDVRMPGLDGPQTLAALQELDPTAVCCFMTGHAGDYTEPELMAQGATRVFAKPFDLIELRSFLWQLTAKTKRRGA
jgi:CheY-like chemotaxis protein